MNLMSDISLAACRKIAGVMVLAFAFAMVLGASPSVAASAGPTRCGDGGKLDTVCGIAVPEDLVAVPGTPWIIASSMPRDGSPGGLYLIETKSRHVEPVVIRRADVTGDHRAPATNPPTSCAFPDLTTLVTHGISLVPGTEGVHRLFVVAHGGREAIELFTVDARGARLEIAWTGCVELPAGLEANSVAGLPDGGFLFTSLYDQGDSDWKSRMGKLGVATPSGGVYKWEDAKGIIRVNAPALSGPNGIAVSQDGNSVFLAGWGDRKLARVDREGRETIASIELDFLPDNLHWAPDGTLLAAGQRTTVAGLFACTTSSDVPDYCVRSYSVARIDPATFAILQTWEAQVPSGFGDSTAAILHDGKLWIGSINGKCVAITDGTAK